MSRAEEIWSVSIFLGLVFCSQRVVSQQIISLSTNISSDTLSSVQFKYKVYEEDIFEEDTTASDCILLRQELTLTPTDYTFLFTNLNSTPDSAFDKPKWFLTSMLEDQRKLQTVRIAVSVAYLILGSAIQLEIEQPEHLLSRSYLNSLISVCL